jgi:hypothetical protein
MAELERLIRRTETETRRIMAEWNGTNQVLAGLNERPITPEELQHSVDRLTLEDVSHWLRLSMRVAMREQRRLVQE